jgi:6-phosphogluconolactonase (cycloisomerase 2 family)
VVTLPAHGRGTTGLSISPDGHTLITVNSASGDVSSFRIDGDGSLSWVTTVATGGGAFYTAVTGDNVLVTNSTVDTIGLLRLTTDSRLSLVSTVPNPAREPRGIVVNQQGDRFYVANFAKGAGPGHITAFTLDAAGIHASGPAVATGSNGAEGIALSSDGKTLYNANFNTDGDGSVTSYPLSGDGSVGPPRTPIATGGHQPDLGSVTVPRR